MSVIEEIRLVSLLQALLFLASLQGCASIRERKPVPEELADAAGIPGIQYARFWGDELPADLDERIEAMKARQEAGDGSGPRKWSGSYLAVSGGAANGAFGAGLLVGWTAAGDRPSFDLVTGISTGALIAPFAFLGPDYDPQLREIYTTISTEDVLERRGLISALTSDAFADTDGLRALIAKYCDEAFLEAIAAEARKGRALLVGTTNLDAGRPVVWSIGQIAQSGHPRALELVRDIFLASASIPGAFPPVYFDVEADGRPHDEMHVDGSTASQVFLYPAALDWRRFSRALGIEGEQRVYVIRNSLMIPQWTTVEAKLGPIVGRAIDTLIKANGVGDIYRIYLGTQRDRLDFNLASIPMDFEEEAKEPFDKDYMNKLFDLGFKMARDGYPWGKAPPGMTPP